MIYEFAYGGTEKFVIGKDTYELREADLAGGGLYSALVFQHAVNSFMVCHLSLVPGPTN